MVYTMPTEQEKKIQIYQQVQFLIDRCYIPEEKRYEVIEKLEKIKEKEDEDIRNRRYPRPSG